MKRYVILLSTMVGLWIASSCQKETVVERVEVQKGNIIHSGMGVPDASLGNIGDYYLDLASSNLYGSKTTEGWGNPISLKGIQGEKGVKGEKGDKGDRGEKGDRGDQGPKGDQGDKGLKGEQGDKGDQGERGEQGIPGSKGDKGDKGDRGLKGERGKQGFKGERGAKGEDGKDGRDGAPGPKGADGKNGRDGAPGPKGADGKDGRDGAPGPKGADGKEGQNGAPGPKGADGKEGKQGPKGADGRDGQAAPAGTKRNTLFSGSGIPNNSLGDEGDFYIDMLNKRLYGPKTNTGWTDRFIGLGASASQNYDYEIKYEKDEGDQFEGDVLKKWLTKRTKHINMNEDEDLRGVKKISADAFRDKYRLESIIIGDNVEVIEGGTFSSLINLKMVVLNHKIKTIQSNTFYYTGLVSITIPENVKEINRGAFADCKDLETVIMESKIPPVIERNETFIFENDSKLKHIYVPTGSKTKYRSTPGWDRYEHLIEER